MYLQIFMKSFFRQLFAHVYPKHIDANTSESDIPAIGQKKLFLQGYKRRRWLPLFRLCALWLRPIFYFLDILVVPKKFIPHVREK